MSKRKKTGGRQKGTPNRTTTQVKKIIGDLLENKFDKFKKELDKLEGRDYVTNYLKLIEYVVPKQRQKLEKIDFSSLTEQEQQTIIDEITEKLKENG